MPQFDLPLDELRRYSPPAREPADFDEFWAETLRETRRHDLAATFTEVETGLTRLVVEDVAFAGHGGDVIRGWMLRPAGVSEPLPCIVHFLGYTNGRGLPQQWTTWPSAGYALLVMDSRGQGNGSGIGATPDPAGSGPQVPGKLTSGIDSPHTYYYRRLFADASRAVEAAKAHPAVDSGRIVVAGGSQGGGIALATAGLNEGIAGALIDVPFLSHFERALRITDNNSYSEITRYLQTRRGSESEVFDVLSYFDGVNFAARASCPTLFSVALCDTSCPPSTVFAAYNRYAGPKDIRVYPYNGHEGGQAVQVGEQLTFVAELLRDR